MRLDGRPWKTVKKLPNQRSPDDVRHAENWVVWVNRRILQMLERLAIHRRAVGEVP